MSFKWSKFILYLTGMFLPVPLCQKSDLTENQS